MGQLSNLVTKEADATQGQPNTDIGTWGLGSQAIYLCALNTNARRIISC